MQSTFILCLLKTTIAWKTGAGSICPKPLKLPRGLKKTLVNMMKAPGLHSPNEVNANLGKGLLFSILVDNEIIDFMNAG
jgi:hypothetical protein